MLWCVYQEGGRMWEDPEVSRCRARQRKQDSRGARGGEEVHLAFMVIKDHREERTGCK